MSVETDLTVLVVDDDDSNRASIEKVLGREKLRVVTASNAREALEIIRNQPIAVVVTDYQMPGMTGIDLLRSVRGVSPETDVILITAYGTIEMAVEAMKQGAYDFVVKPFKRHDIVRPVKRALEKQELILENRRLKAELAESKGNRAIIGQSTLMRETLELVDQVAPSSATVLITGESGTGKELIARATHNGSGRSGQFVAVNCAAIPDTILESELFGYEKGAFTGAVGRREGRFERADGGTLFLDEIGEMAPHVQVKLLRVLQEGEIERLGGTQTIKVDCRIVAATNRDLLKEVAEGRFREDLYYRLNVITVPLPPLRDRNEDVPLLAHHFLNIYAKKNNKNIGGIEQDALEALTSHTWPGNVRELENVLERAVVLSRGGLISIGELPGRIQNGGAAVRSIAIPLGMPLDEVEQRLVSETLKMTGGDKRLAAQLLGIATRTIYRKLDAWRADGVEVPDFAEGESTTQH
ncbi:MAG: two-component system response regulator HydG [Myxococcota bacterium]|jgi:two-component system response regulator HydG